MECAVNQVLETWREGPECAKKYMIMGKEEGRDERKETRLAETTGRIITI